MKQNQRDKRFYQATARDWRILQILEDAEQIVDDGMADSFCGNAVFYGYPGSGYGGAGYSGRGFKKRVASVVGRYAKGAPEKNMTMEVYDVVYQTIYDTLPNCRGNCACL